MDEIEILGLFVNADEAAGEPQTFVMTYTGPRERAWVSVVGWPGDAEVPSEHTMDDLAQRRWLRILQVQGKTRHVAVTSIGREEWAKHVVQSAHEQSVVDLSWQATQATLRHVYELYREQGAPAMGVWVVPLQKDPTFGREVEAHISELIRGGYLDVGRDSAARPTNVRPTVLAHQLLGGWPADPAHAALEELVHEIDLAIERTPDEGRRSKLIALRGLLVGAGRDIALAWVEKKIGAG